MINGKILVVEDEQIVALDIQRRLTNLNYQVVAIADRAQAALDAIAEFSPDLILMDIHLKGDIDGIAVAQLIREQYKLPVVFLTAHADEATVNQAKELQPFGYLVKPVQTKHLSMTIDIALGRHQAEKLVHQALEKEHQLSLALQATLQREQELNAFKSQFLSMISHEFRNPLSSIVFTLSLLERYNEKLTPAQRLTYIERAKNACQTLTQLVDDILLLRGGEMTQFQYQPEPIDILWLCRHFLDEFQQQLSDKHPLQFHFISDQEAEGYFCELDLKLLRHILTNLLSNAVKYSPEGGEIDVRLYYQSEFIRLEVQDHGLGITPEVQAHLFEPFYRGNNVDSISGVGLGLAIVKKCVDAHRGTITLQSEPGQGTTFMVTLPRHHPEN